MGEDCKGNGSCGACEEKVDTYRFDSKKDVPAWERYELEKSEEVIPSVITDEEWVGEFIRDYDETKESNVITGGHPLFHKLIDTMRDIHNRKNADYGAGKQLGNFMEAEDFGVEAWRGALVRLSDKYSRIKSLANRLNQEGEVKNESFEDTLIDLANYALLTIVLYKERK